MPVAAQPIHASARPSSRPLAFPPKTRGRSPMSPKDLDRAPRSVGAQQNGVSRRTFLTASAAVGGGFLLDFSIPAFATGESGASAKSATLNAYIRIMPNGETFIVNKN